jgi:dipeptidyl aminopeptidase/acylaminoacyl peptidase
MARRSLAALLACLLVAACGTGSATPSGSAAEGPPGASGSAESAGPSPGLSAQLARGTRCGANAAFGGPAATSSAAGAHPPAWSRRVALFAVSSIAASPDGKVLAIAGSSENGRTVQLWNADGSRVATLDDGETDAGAVTCAAWSPDGSLVAGAYRSGEVRLWDRAGQVVRMYQGTDPVFSLAWSPDGSMLATGAIRFPAQAASSETPGAGASAGPSESAASGQTPLPGVIRVWRRDGTLAETLGTRFTGGKFLNLEWSPDGSMLAAGAVDYLVWRVDGSQVGEPRTGGSPAWAMAWSPYSDSLAIGDENGIVEIVGVDGTTRSSHTFAGGVNALGYSPDGASVAVGRNSAVSVARAENVGTVVWTADSAAAQAIWSPDGRALLIATPGGLAVVGPDGSVSTALGSCPGGISAFAWDGSTVVAATDSGWLCGW